MANTLSFDQVSAILASVVKQATGQAVLTATNTYEFVAQAQSALLAGYDPLATAISQVLADTIFSVRPYSEHFKGLKVTNQKYGNHVRKLTALDRDPVNSEVYGLTDGTAVDQYVVRKPIVLQTNFYGESAYQDFITIYTVQIDNAMKGPDEFGEFISMIIQNMNDRMTQRREELARATMANMIAATYSQGDSSCTYNLLREYNTYTGLSLTATTVKAPANYGDFIKFAYGFINNISDMMTNRSKLYHLNYEDGNGNELTIMRHTPYSRQKLYMSSFEANYIDSRVLSSTFNADKLKLIDFEPVSFWQSIKTPDAVKVKPSYVDYTDGTVVNAANTVDVEGIFAVLFDEEAVGYTITDESVERSPYNARGKYWNQFWSDTKKYWNDMTENFVIFVIQDYTP